MTEPTKMTLEQFIKFFSKTVKEAFCIAYGAEKWEQLTDKQKHDVIMILAKDFQNKSPAVGL